MKRNCNLHSIDLRSVGKQATVPPLRNAARKKRAKEKAALPRVGMTTLVRQLFVVGQALRAG